MCLYIGRIGIMDIICRYQLDPQLLRHADKLRIYQTLLRDSVILKLQKEISFSKNALITQGSLFRFFVQPPYQIPGNLSCQAGA